MGTNVWHFTWLKIKIVGLYSFSQIAHCLLSFATTTQKGDVFGA